MRTKGLRIERGIDGEEPMLVIPSNTEKHQKTDLITPLLQHFDVVGMVEPAHNPSSVLAGVYYIRYGSKCKMDIVGDAEILGHIRSDNL